MRSSRPTELRIGQHSPSGEVHFSINKTPSLQFPPIPERATQMVRQAQEKVRKDKTSQHVELGGPAARASSDLVTFLRGRRMRTADRRGPRLRQRTDTERKETRDRQTEKKSFCFFYIVFLWVFLFVCFVLFFPDSPTRLRVGESGPAGSSCGSGCLGSLCLRSEAAVCCHRAA